MTDQERKELLDELIKETKVSYFTYGFVIGFMVMGILATIIF